MIHAMIHSKGKKDRIEAIRKLPGDNKYGARYKEEWYSAIFNPFSGLYYVDDKYGKVPDDLASELEKAAADQIRRSNDELEDDWDNEM